MTEREIFLAAMENNDPIERATYLDQVCGGDATLRQRVERLLRSHAQAADFMAVPVVEQLSGDAEGLEFLPPSQKPGSLGCLAQYEILEVIGRGGMGIVFRAFDTKLHRVVALKALAPQLATSSAARQRFVREARAAAAITHDHIIAIHTVEDAGPVPYLVMQFIDGPTLQKKLDRTGLLSLKEILRIALQIAEGLAAAHRQGLVHRDIKPANILLDNGIERVKITDFGLARAIDDASLTQSGVMAGTPMYMSPEQADGQYVDFRSDLFSLGSVMYAMCTGLPPFRARNSLAVLKRVCEENPRPITEIHPELPAWLGEVVARLHAKAPADRFASAREVADLLAQRLAELQNGGAITPVATAPQSAAIPVPDRSAPVPRRLTRPWAMAAAVLLALLAGLGLSEVTRISNIRGKVTRFFSHEDPLVAKTDDPAVDAKSAPAQAVAAAEDAASISAWERTIASLPPQQQVEAVAARLQKLNSGFDGKVTPIITEDTLRGLIFSTDQVTNIAPVRALSMLEFLNVESSAGKLADLSPLTGMKLSRLICNKTQVSDLSPLKGMPLIWLECSLTKVSDLGPLKDLPLQRLFCECSALSNLTPLKGMSLVHLDVGGSRVTDLSPLHGMPLKSLDLFVATQLTNLAPVQGMPLEYLNIGRTMVSDLASLKEMTTLHDLILDHTPVSDLFMLKGLALRSLLVQGTSVSNLAPLRGMPLKQVWVELPLGENAAVLRSLRGLEKINNMPADIFWKAQQND